MQQRRRPGLPSWVPEWDVPLDSRGQVLSRPRFETHVSRVFSAGGGENATMRIGEDQNVLVVKGRIFDVVSVLGAPGPEVGSILDPSPVRLMTAVEELRSLLSSLNQGYPTGEDIDDVWWRTCICDRHSKMDWKAPPEYRELLHLWQLFSSLEAAAEAEDSQTFTDLAAKLAPYFPDSRLPDSYEGFDGLKNSTIEYQLGCLKYWPSARNCLASKGYICRAPCNVASGDVVAVFDGVEVPYLLRSVGENQYRLMGNCYCHGIMYGEALNMLDLEACDIEIV